MDDWPPIRYGGDDEEDRPAPNDRGNRTERYPDRFSEAVGDAWESGTRRDPFGDLDAML